MPLGALILFSFCRFSRSPSLVPGHLFLPKLGTKKKLFFFPSACEFPLLFSLGTYSWWHCVPIVQGVAREAGR
ncbi:hypothetical protein BC940DRAFT_309066 [Gongronella butleri]|nr:hypothetical protein BC940DRAFT_309066 [Gongronella butleri]